MIKLTNDYVIKSDEHSYMLCKLSPRKDKPDYYEPIRYYLTIPDAIEGLLELNQRKLVSKEDLITIKELKKGSEKLLEEIKNNISDLEIDFKCTTKSR